MSTYTVGTGSSLSITGTASLSVANTLVTLVLIRPPTTAGGMGFRILRAEISQKGTATSAQYEIALASKATAFGTYVSATPAPTRVGGPASVIAGGTTGAQGTSGINASAEGAGTVTGIVAANFNNLNGWTWVPGPGEVIEFANNHAGGFQMLFPVAPGSLTSWNWNVTYQEI